MSENMKIHLFCVFVYKVYMHIYKYLNSGGGHLGFSHAAGLAEKNRLGTTVVPATSGHLRFGAKVAPRSRWPLVAGNGNS